MRAVWLAFTVLLSTNCAQQATASTPRLDVVGSYYHGDGKGVNLDLILEHDHRFSYESHTDTVPGPVDKLEGRWTLSGVVLFLLPSRPDRPAVGLKSLDTRFLVVRWGKRIYLLASKGPADLKRWSSNERKRSRSWEGDNPRNHAGFIRFDPKTGGVPPLEGKPDLPPVFARFGIGHNSSVRRKNRIVGAKTKVSEGTACSNKLSRRGNSRRTIPSDLQAACTHPEVTVHGAGSKNWTDLLTALGPLGIRKLTAGGIDVGPHDEK